MKVTCFIYPSTVACRKRNEETDPRTTYFICVADQSLDSRFFWVEQWRYRKKVEKASLQRQLYIIRGITHWYYAEYQFLRLPEEKIHYGVGVSNIFSISDYKLMAPYFVLSVCMCVCVFMIKKSQVHFFCVELKNGESRALYDDGGDTHTERWLKVYLYLSAMPANVCLHCGLIAYK